MIKFIKFLFYFSLFPLLILLLVVAGYFVFDPFKVLYKYNDYSYPLVNYNSYYVSTESFLRNKKKYKIVLSPLYEQEKLSPDDFKLLKTLFGDNLYDFTGKNTFTDSKYNYYEQSHYRTTVGDSILSIIYHPKQ